MACQSEPPTQVCTGVLAEAPSRGGPRSSKDQVGPPRCAEWPHKTGTSEEVEQGQARAGVGSRGGALGCTELSGGAADLNSRPDCASQGSQERGVFGWLSCVCGQAASRSPACSAQSGAGVSSLGAGTCRVQAVCARRCCRACGFGGRGVTGSRKEGARGHERAPQDLCWAERGRRPGWGKSPGDPRYRSGPRVPGQASGSTTHPGAPPTQVHTWACAELLGPRGARPRKPTGQPWARCLHTTPHSVPSPVGDNGTSPVWLPKSLRNRKVP